MSNPSKEPHSGRNVGIDLLRIVAMCYVLVLHIQGYGGVKDAVVNVGQLTAVWMQRIWAMCAVNCYAIVSGYVGYCEEERPYAYSRYIVFWLQAVFYGVVGAGVFLIAQPSMVYVKHLILAFTPITSGQWWYFTAYTALFFMIPWLNKLVRNCTKREVTAAAVVCLLLFSVYTTAASLFKEPFQLSEGYSFLWLAILYLVGAWMKKCRIPERISCKMWIMVYLCCYVVACAVKILLLLGLQNTQIKVAESYLSPLIVAMAIAHVCVFSRMKLPDWMRRLVISLAPAAFGVFLLHMQWDVLDGLILGRFVGITQLPAWMIPLAVIAIAIAMLAICLLVDKVRIWLFAKMQVNRLADAITKRVQRIWDTVYQKCFAGENE